MQRLAEERTAAGRPLDAAFLKALNRAALFRLAIPAGRWRQTGIVLGDHTPPPAEAVPALMRDLFATLPRLDWPPRRLAALVLWRLIWIHPFLEGNGRTARAAAAFLLGAPEQAVIHLQRGRERYVAGLRRANRAAAQGTVELSALERWLGWALAPARGKEDG